jgi:hypothetical protein
MRVHQIELLIVKRADIEGKLTGAGQAVGQTGVEFAYVQGHHFQTQLLHLLLQCADIFRWRSSRDHDHALGHSAVRWLCTLLLVHVSHARQCLVQLRCSSDQLDIVERTQYHLVVHILSALQSIKSARR